MQPPIIIFIIMFGGIFVAVFVAMILAAVKRAKQQQTQDEYAKRYNAQRAAQQTVKTQQSGMSSEQRQRLEYLREKQREKSAYDRHEKHVQDAHEHGHTGVEEHYEEIVGSLGDVNDEGCEDLNGVRFIAHDLAYDVSDSEHHDYTKLARAIVLGEVINSPRFKQPYKKK